MMKFVQLLDTTDGLYALGDDGSVWYWEADGNPHWQQQFDDARTGLDPAPDAPSADEYTQERIAEALEKITDLLGKLANGAPAYERKVLPEPNRWQKLMEAAAITDPELSQALSKKANEIKDHPRIRALIGEFVRPGESYVKIPQDRRAEFLAQLAAMKKEGAPR
jgi:hypothetical protein